MSPKVTKLLSPKLRTELEWLSSQPPQTAPLSVHGESKVKKEEDGNLGKTVITHMNYIVDKIFYGRRA